MGNNESGILFTHLWKQDQPEAFSPSKYDPQYGFEGRERQELKPDVTLQEMDSAGLDLELRDNCARTHLTFKTCLRYNAPFWFMCKGYYNEVLGCLYDNKIVDMKEFEREKRLNIRERRIREKNGN